jgi:hypothetical protein
MDSTPVPLGTPATSSNGFSTAAAAAVAASSGADLAILAASAVSAADSAAAWLKSEVVWCRSSAIGNSRPR